MTTMDIDWSQATFETGDDEQRRVEEERMAMEALQARLAEREGQRHDWSRPADPLPLLAANPRPRDVPMAAPPSLPQPPMPGDLDSASQPPIPVPSSSATGDPGPPAISTSPQTPEPTAEASQNPTTPTTTAGSQAASLRQQQGQTQQPEQGAQQPGGPVIDLPEVDIIAEGPPRPVPGITGGATGIGNPLASTRQRIGQPETGQERYDRELQASRDEDVRRRRIRGILMGLAALGGMGTIGSGGSMGGALPGLIAAGMVRRPDEEETYRADDERRRELDEENERRRMMLEQLEQQRTGQMSQDAYRQQQLALRERELEASNADRSLRTQLQVNADRREAAMRDASSDESRTARERFTRLLPTLPQDLQDAVRDMDLSTLSARDIDILQDDYAGIETGRQRGGGGGRGGVASAATGRGGSSEVQGINVAPQAYINLMSSRIMEEQGVARPEAERLAQAYWDAKDDGERESFLESTAADRWRTRNIAQWEQINPGQTGGENWENEVSEIADAAAQIEQLEQETRELDEQYSNASIQERIDAAVNPNSELNAQYEAILSDLIAQSVRIRGGGAMDQNEYQRERSKYPSLRDLVRIGAPGNIFAPLYATFNRLNRGAEARMSSHGMRRREEPAQGRTGQRSEQGGDVVRIRVTAPGRGTRTVRSNRATLDATVANLERQGATVEVIGQ